MDDEFEEIQLESGEFIPGRPQFAGACFGFNVTPRKGAAPLVTMFVEDDGFWHMKESFDISWADDIIQQLQEVKKHYPKE